MKQLLEAISAAAFPKASALIQSYLRKQLGTSHVYTYPEPEHFTSGSGVGVGIRYFINKQESVRFNWLSDGSIDTSKNLVSVDYWDGHSLKGTPLYHMKFDAAQSLVKSLPAIVDFIKNPKPGQILWAEESILDEAVANVASTFTTLVEMRIKEGNLRPTIENVIRGLAAGGQLKYLRHEPDIGFGFNKVFMAIRNEYPQFFERRGVSVVFADAKNAAKIDINKIIKRLGGSSIGATVSPGTAETIRPSAEVQTMEDQLPRLCFEEQLSDLRKAMVLLMNNATNSLWLGGRGGIGKTATVEEELAKRGLSDGNGYFKITGSASTAGIYRILYTHRRDILLFDDSDGALADQDSRNLFKAASDTKKQRKIAWMKSGKNYVDPDDMDEDDEDGDPDILPRYFDFTGKIIFISNLKLDKLDPDGALRTRGFVLNIDPTDEEVYKYMSKIVAHIKLEVNFALKDDQRQHVINLLKSRKLKEGSANLRQLVRGLNVLAGILSGGGTVSDADSMILRYA